MKSFNGSIFLPPRKITRRASLLFLLRMGRPTLFLPPTDNCSPPADNPRRMSERITYQELSLAENLASLTLSSVSVRDGNSILRKRHIFHNESMLPPPQVPFPDELDVLYSARPPLFSSKGADLPPPARIAASPRIKNLFHL